MRVWTLIDERSTAFFGLGLAKATRAPVAILSTSGTAAANFFPAVVEARYGRTPLVVLTADRPHELRDTGANQTIDQIRLYGAHAKWFVDLALPETTDAALRAVRSIAGQAVAAARNWPAGAVHLNVPVREPLVPVVRAGDLPSDRDRREPWDGRPAEQPYAAVSRPVHVPSREAVRALARDLRSAPRGLIVCGPQDDADFPKAVAGLAAALQYPILADPLSQARCGPHDRALVIDAYDPMLRVRAVAETPPDVILRFGATPSSRPLADYLTRHGGARQIVVDESPTWTDPLRLASDVIQADARATCDALSAEAARAAPGGEWASRWVSLAARARQAIAEQVASFAEPFEGRVFARLSEILPDGVTVYVGNSMPVRDLESFLPGTSRRIRFLGNRGASGIDGVISSALGFAAAGGPVVLVLGDLAFYHDMNGLLAAKLHRLAATIVVLNNDGGGIFSFLPQAQYPEYFEELFGTPTGLEFRHAAEMYGASFVRIDEPGALDEAVRRGAASNSLNIVEMRTDRTRNVELHGRVWAAVDEALQPLVQTR
jgi:2-succinyl-5-enolpyruvyl-6-hydroxy-3-cyclohexene-1-carboxylate synthase